MDIANIVSKELNPAYTEIKGEIPYPNMVTHQYVNQKYKFVIERASVKGIDGFKVEVNSDDMKTLEKDILILYNKAKSITGGLYA